MNKINSADTIFQHYTCTVQNNDEIMSKINLQEPQRNRNATANYVHLIMTSTVKWLYVCLFFKFNFNYETSLALSKPIFLVKLTEIIRWFLETITNKNLHLGRSMGWHVRCYFLHPPYRNMHNFDAFFLAFAFRRLVSWCCAFD